MSIISKFQTFFKEALDAFVDQSIDKSDDSRFLCKSEDELREVTGIVLVPEEVDLHGDIYSEDEIHKAMISFNTLCRNTRLQHSVDAGAQVIESYQVKSDDIIGGKLVKKGSWLITMKLPEEEWAMVKNGLFTGFSIGCMARGEPIGSEEGV